MNMLHAVVLGIIEGITEFLPVSSTGHLILAGRWLALKHSDFLSSFDITIQLGAILAVVVLYRRILLVDRKAWGKILAAFVPTAVIGLAFYKIVKKLLFGNVFVVAWALLLGGLFLIIFERLYREREDAIEEIAQLSYKKAIVIGLFQSLAIVPGVSRAAATIIGGLVLGLKRKTIVEFSFLLAVPTMFAAAGLDLMKNVQSFSGGELGLLCAGFMVSFVVAIVSIKFLLSFIKNHNFILFGIYRIIIALLFFLGAV